MSEGYRERVGAGLELRVAEGGRISGLAAVVYDGSPATEYRLAENVVERIMPGAFDRAIGPDADVVCCFNHDLTKVLGRVSAGTLELRSSGAGLSYVANSGNTTIATDMREMIARGEVKGSSIAFLPAPDGERVRREGATLVQEITEIARIRDVGPATIPAYEGTTASLRGRGDCAAEVARIRRRAEATDRELRENPRIQALLARYQAARAMTRYRSEYLRDRSFRAATGLLGAWMMRSGYLESAFASVASGLVERAKPETRDADVAPVRGVAWIEIRGEMLKYASDWGGTSTRSLRARVRAAAADPSVKAIGLVIDSPGGQVDGTDELATAVAAAAARKPVHAYVDDCCCSAAYYVASQADRISVNRAGEVGSIGAYQALVDMSRACEMKGMRVHVVSSGPDKGKGFPGLPVDDELIADIQRRIDEVHTLFMVRVATGRKLQRTAVARLATGRVFSSETALSLGLVDAVESEEDARAALQEQAELVH